MVYLGGVGPDMALPGAAVAEIFAACINGAGETLTLPDLVRWGNSASHRAGDGGDFPMTKGA